MKHLRQYIRNILLRESSYGINQVASLLLSDNLNKINQGLSQGAQQRLLSVIDEKKSWSMPLGVVTWNIKLSDELLSAIQMQGFDHLDGNRGLATGSAKIVTNPKKHATKFGDSKDHILVLTYVYKNEDVD